MDDPFFFDEKTSPLSIFIISIYSYLLCRGRCTRRCRGHCCTHCTPSIYKTDIQGNTRIKHRCTLFVDKILYRRMQEDKMRGGLPALIRPRIV